MVVWEATIATVGTTEGLIVAVTEVLFDLHVPFTASTKKAVVVLKDGVV